MSSRSKILTRALTIAVLSAFTFTFSLGLTTKEVNATTIENVSPRTIEVTGTSTVKATPDIAIIDVGVTTNGVTATSVQSDNTKTMNNILTSVKALGIDGKDITTISYNMYPQYDQSSTKSSSKIVGYTLNNMVEIKVRDITIAGKVLSTAVNAGANVNYGISFSLSNADEYYNQALSKAMSNAKSKADTLAKAIGVKIGVPSRVVENSSYYAPSPVANYSLVAANADMGGSTSAAVSQGEISVTANVSVTYEY